MSEALYIAAGAVAGFVIGWLWSKGGVAKREGQMAEVQSQSQRKDAELERLGGELARANEARVSAETELRGLREQKEFVELAKKELSDVFNSLSAAALKSSSEDFLRLASENLGKVVEETKGKLGEHKAAMDGLIKPLNETLKRYDEQLRDIERKRGQAYTSLDEQIKMLASTHERLRQETGNLVTALRKPHVRGRWGESQLKRVVELAGMSPHCDFTEQVSVAGDEGRLRPDMVVHLPGGRDIVVDSKVSLDAFFEALAAKTEEERATAMKRHLGQVKKHISDLGSKAYWQQFGKSPELVVCFMGEAALVAALEAEPTLMEDSMSKRVVVATPTTLFALLTAVAFGWRQEQVTKNAEEIARIGKELYERVSVWAKHIGKVGASLGSTVEAYNSAVGSMESRVLPSVRKFKELGATGAEEIPPAKQVEKTPRNLNLLD
jgi:DNA recombination protein RmuC